MATQTVRDGVAEERADRRRRDQADDGRIAMRGERTHTDHDRLAGHSREKRVQRHDDEYHQVDPR
ncbi:hypothetical protein ACFQ1L_22655 [Phytohabitans flavus]|uniref:hypothetical protein n=1 Tax=Phytohabitans flavus TaxID=1076124 RepID=UPI001563A29A|nr:hypothetical protein [Phytohabitans flavus]